MSSQLMPGGSGGGRGQGQGGGRGQGRGQGSGGGGRAMGPGGECYCPDCGTTVAHQQGVPCFEQLCPKCGRKMTRK